MRLRVSACPRVSSDQIGLTTAPLSSPTVAKSLTGARLTHRSSTLADPVSSTKATFQPLSAASADARFLPFLPAMAFGDVRADGALPTAPAPCPARPSLTSRESPVIDVTKMCAEPTGARDEGGEIWQLGQRVIE